MRRRFVRSVRDPLRLASYADALRAAEILKTASPCIRVGVDEHSTPRFDDDHAPELQGIVLLSGEMAFQHPLNGGAVQQSAAPDLVRCEKRPQKRPQLVLQPLANR